MHPKKFQNVISLSAVERYNYFIRVVADRECLWGLQDSNGDWAIDKTELGDTYLFWPEQEFADAATDTEWSDCKAAPIELTDFMDCWLPDMAKDGERVGIFLHPLELVGQNVEPLGLLQDLEDECEQYE